MKVVIVEDDLFFQKFYSSKLHENGLDVTIASNGEEGLTKIKEVKPDIIILDIIMPIKDGFQVLTELSQDPVYKNIPVLVFSSLGQEADIKKALSLGAKGYVTKSLFNFEELLAKIFRIVPKNSYPAQ